MTVKVMSGISFDPEACLKQYVR